MRAVLRRLLGRSTNNILRAFNLELREIARDFDARLESKIHFDRAINAATDAVEVWLRKQKTWKYSKTFDIGEEIKMLYFAYLESPFRDPKGGSRFGNLLWLNLLAKLLEPDVVVDSGTYMGGSAWALARGAARAKIMSFDIDLSRLVMRVPGVNYIQGDWTTVDYTEFGKKRLVYFDDHVSQGRRLREASERDFEYAIFDDDFSVTNFSAMAYGGAALPKVSFILDDALQDGELIEWSVKGQKYQWKVDKPALDVLKNRICSADRLPNLGEAFGIDQLPYRIIKLKISQDWRLPKALQPSESK